MKILHIHNMMIRNNGVFKFYSGRKFSNGIIRNNHTLLEFSDRDLCRYNSLFHIRPIGKQRIQKQLIQTVLNFKPDMILFGHCDIITNQTLLKIRKLLPSVKIAHWFLDALWINKNINRLKNRMDYVDSIFITTAGKMIKNFKTSHNIVSYIPNPVDLSEDSLNNSNILNFRYDLLFCGLGRKSDYRTSFVNDLRKLLSNEINFELRGFVGDKPLWGEEYKKILSRTKMGLNLNGIEDYPLYSSDRISQLMGNGILTFLWNKGRMNELINENHAVFFDSINDLYDKINYYNNNDNDRKKIANEGYAYYHKNFSSKNIIKYIIETTFRLPFSEEYKWKKECFKD